MESPKACGNLALPPQFLRAQSSLNISGTLGIHIKNFTVSVGAAVAAEKARSKNSRDVCMLITVFLM
jgi:hypothetical protein